MSDGIIAPDYDPAALEILKAKKGGNFIVLKADPNYTPPEMEYRCDEPTRPRPRPPHTK